MSARHFRVARNPSRPPWRHRKATRAENPDGSDFGHKYSPIPCELFIGGVAAVIMELAEPRVRTGVWEHTTFRIDPVRRLRPDGTCCHGYDLRRPQHS